MAFEWRELLNLGIELGAMVAVGYFSNELKNLTESHAAYVCFGAWYFFAFLANFCAISAYCINAFGPPEYYNAANIFLRRHYALAWFAGIAYFGLVSYIWHTYSGSYMAYLQVIIVLVPLYMRYLANAQMIELTQIATLMALLSQAYVCYLAENQYGMYTAGVMVLFAFSLSVSTEISRELLEVSLLVASYTIYKTAEHLIKHPTQLKHIPPWY